MTATLARHRRVLVAAGIALAVYMILRNRGGGGGGGDIATSPLPLGPGDAALPAADPGILGAGLTSAGVSADPNDLATVLTSRLDDLGLQTSDLQSQVSGLSFSTPADVQAAVDQLAAQLPQTGTSADTPRDVGASGQTPPAAPGNAKAADSPSAKGFEWGGRFITSPGQLESFERSHGNSGFNIATWASQHPQAAQSIGLKPPPPRATLASPSAPVVYRDLVATTAAPAPPGAAGSSTPSPLPVPVPVTPVTVAYAPDAVAVATRTGKAVAL